MTSLLKTVLHKLDVSHYNLENDNLKSQFTKSSWGGRRKFPFAFTEHVVVTLSSINKTLVAVITSDLNTLVLTMEAKEKTGSMV